MLLNRILLLGLVVTSVVFASSFAQAQNYPTKPVTVIVPFAPGNFTDTMARIVLPAVETALGQSFVIENRGGANGIIGTSSVARAEPDGYTILIGTNGTQSAAPSLYSTLNYDPLEDFDSIALLGTISSVLLVSASSPLNSMEDVIAEAKKRGGMLNYGAPNSTARFSAARLEMLAGIKLTEVPYSGTQQALTDLIGGRVDMLFNGVGSSTDLVRDGKVKALGVTYQNKLAAFPDIKPIADVVPGYFSYGWLGVFAPKGTPQDIIERLNNVFNEALQNPEVRSRLETASFDIRIGTPLDLDQLVSDDIKIWADVAAAAAWVKY